MRDGLLHSSAQAVNLTIRRAGAGDYEQVVRLLEAADLPTAGLSPGLRDFIVAEKSGRIVGAVGLEVYGEAALLRSAVVDPARRGTGLGGGLVGRLLELAKEKGVRQIYLLTTTAEEYFPRFGFAPVARDAVTPAVRASEEFKGACPDSAVAMRLVLDGT